MARQKGTPKKERRWEKAFLAELANRGVVLHACKAAKITRSKAYDYRQQNPEFAEAWDNAINLAADLLEAEAIRRGRDGVKKPVYQGGERVGYIQEYSDTLLIFMLKAVRPEKYRERFDIKGKVALSAGSTAADEEEREIAALLERRGQAALVSAPIAPAAIE